MLRAKADGSGQQDLLAKIKHKPSLKKTLIIVLNLYFLQHTKTEAQIAFLPLFNETYLIVLRDTTNTPI